MVINVVRKIQFEFEIESGKTTLSGVEKIQIKHLKILLVYYIS